MRNTNSPPSYGQPGQAPPGARTAPSWSRAGGTGGGPQGMPGNIEAWRQRMQQMPRQPVPQGPMQGMAGMGQAIAEMMRRRQQGQQQMPGPAPQQPGGMEMMPNTNAPPPQRPPVQPPQQGMAGLGQVARAMYDKSRVNALRGGGGRAAPGNVQEV